jgi:hypothetical protein
MTSARAADAFIDRLAAQPLSRWLDLGRVLVSDRSGLRERQRAWRRVDSVIAAHALSVSAWYIRDAVDTIVFLCSCERQRWTGDERLALAAAHAAAEAAALSLLVQGLADEREVELLCAPFGPKAEAARVDSFRLDA